jgi:predicted Holliday junction resolvase-like endonuclease
MIYWKIGAALALIAALIFGGNRAIHSLKESARQEVRIEYQVRDLTKAVEDAKADKAFAEAQQKKSEEQAQELRQTLTDALKRVQASRTVIHERVASGELPNGSLSPTIEAAIDQTEQLEKERMK